jgi:hypothetical protein
VQAEYTVAILAIVGGFGTLFLAIGWAILKAWRKQSITIVFRAAADRFS